MWQVGAARLAFQPPLRKRTARGASAEPLEPSARPVWRTGSLRVCACLVGSWCHIVLDISRSTSLLAWPFFTPPPPHTPAPPHPPPAAIVGPYDRRLPTPSSSLTWFYVEHPAGRVPEAGQNPAELGCLPKQLVVSGACAQEEEG